MSSYTMQLREIIEMFSQEEELPIREQIEKGRTKLFDFDYPIFDVDYKKVFETHFIRKFYIREIGFETEGLFKFNLESWLLINMPYFNKLFESELIQFDPLTNSKIETTYTKTTDKDQTQNSTTDGNSTSESTQDSNGTLNDDHFDRQLESTTPDSRLTITSNDGVGVIEYASNIKENKETDSKTSTGHSTGSSSDTTNVSSNVTGSINETEDYIQSRAGKTGDQSYSKMLSEYRESLIRIENKIFNEMQELFMLVY
jgi:hypothetical protein